MDLLSIAGVILGLVAILGGNVLEGGTISGLYNAPAALIVIGGTFGAAFLHTPLITFRHLLTMIPWIFKPPVIELKSEIDKIVNWAKLARREGLLGLEGRIRTTSDIFSSKALQLLVDGNDPDNIRNILELEMIVKENQDIQSARVLESMGGYAPTIGIIGAVIGLIHVMGNLSDPNKLGPGIATAFVATIYGVGFANLLFIPMANKLKSIIFRLSQSRELLIEGVIAVADGESPRAIEMKLVGYLDSKLQAPLMRSLYSQEKQKQ